MAVTMRAAALVALLAAVGCIHDVDGDGTIRVGIAGDSNSGPGSGHPMWGDLLPTLLERVTARHGVLVYRAPVVVLTQAIGGATACDHSDAAPWRYGPQQVEALVAANADVVIAAFGTNDLRWPGGSVTQAVACLAALEARVPRGVLFLPATAPPIHAAGDPGAAGISEYNRLVRARWPRVVDFDTGFVPEWYTDGLHVGPRGQAERARRARLALLG